MLKRKEEIEEEFIEKFVVAYPDREPELSYKDVGQVLDFVHKIRADDEKKIIEEVQKLKRYDFIADEVYEEKDGEYIAYEDLMQIINKLKENI